MSVFAHANARPRVCYRVELPAPEQHLVEVTLTLVDVDAGRVQLRMPAWSPGSYLIRDYARFVRGLRARGRDGAPLAVCKRDKHSWDVQTNGSDHVELWYQVYGYDLTVRTNHIDSSHAFLHGPAMFLYVPDRAAEPCRLEVAAPAPWQVHCGLPAAADGAGFVAADLDELLDSPVHAGLVDVHEFAAAGRPARLVVWGGFARGGVVQVDQLVGDLQSIMEAHAARFGGVPYRDYTFLLMLSPGAYGGLEHRNSSANLHSPLALASRRSYEDLLRLLSHEYFHVWNGKRIRPAGLGPFDYGAECYTRSLWVQEGVTSYCDRYTLRRAGCQTVQAFLEGTAESWARLQRVPGRLVDSLEEASFDAWIKLYKPDASTVNSTVSYYLKGGLVALTLDLEIRRQTDGTKCLDDALRRLWDRYGAADSGYRDDAVLGELEAATGASLGEFFARYVRGTEDPDLAGALSTVGLELREVLDPAPADGTTAVWLGVALAGGEVKAVLADGPGYRAGLSPWDEIIAVSGLRCSDERELREHLAALRPGELVELALFRQGRLMTVRVELAAAPANRFEIASVATATPEQRQRFQTWLGEPFADTARVAGYTTTGWT
jgi:predicted metalloprotease with PDZ domain